MNQSSRISAQDIRAANAENTELYPLKSGEKLGVSEAQLIAAQTGHGVVRINAHPDQLIAHVQNLG